MTTFDVNTTGKEVVAKLGSRLEGKTVVITGPSPKSLGAQLVVDLASGLDRANMILVGRSEAKITLVMDEIRSINPAIHVTFVQIDLTNNATVRAAADKIKKLTSTVDVLVNCAGVLGLREFTQSANGVEMHFAANHLGHFLLTNLLVDELAAAKGRVVNVTSMGYGLAELDVKDANFDNGKLYATWPAYAASKTANILFSHSVAEKYQSKGITAVAADPGMVYDTQLQANTSMDHDLLMKGFELAQKRNVPHTDGVSIQQGAGALLVGMLGDYTAPSTDLLHEGGPIKGLSYATDKGIAEGLWQLSEKLVGQTFA